MSEIPSTAGGPFVVDSNMAAASEREDERLFMLDFAEKSDSARAPFVPIWDEVIDNYLVTPHGGSLTRSESGMYRPDFRTGVGRRSGAVLKDTETHQIIRTMTSQALSLILPSADYVKAIPVGSDDPEKARLMSRLTRAWMEGPGVYRTAHMCFGDSFLLGTSISGLWYQQLERLQVTNEPVMDMETGQPTRFYRNEPKVYKDGPQWRLHDLYQFFPDPSGTSIQDDMCGVAYADRISKYAAEIMAEKSIWNPAATKKVLDSMKDGSGASSTGRRDERFPEYLKAVPNKQGRLHILEYWGEVPWLPKDKARNRVLTLLCGENVRSHINPFTDGQIPFKECVVNPIAGRFYGLSPAEVIRYIQDYVDSLLMVSADVGAAAITAPTLIGNTFGGDRNRIRRKKPLDLIECNDVNQVKPWPQDFSVLQYAGQLIMQEKMRMREGSGQTNTVQSINSSDRTTATEASLLFQAASLGTDVMVRLMEKDFLPWLGRTFLSRMQQFMPKDGILATLDGETFGATLDDIQGDADVRFVGSRHAGNKGQKMAGLQQFLAVLGSAPQLLDIAPEIITRILRDGADVEDAAELIEASRQNFRNYEARQMVAGLIGQQGGEGGGSAPELDSVAASGAEAATNAGASAA